MFGKGAGAFLLSHSTPPQSQIMISNLYNALFQPSTTTAQQQQLQQQQNQLTNAQLLGSQFMGGGYGVGGGIGGYYQNNQFLQPGVYYGGLRRPRLLPTLPMRPLPLSPSRYRRYQGGKSGKMTTALGPHYEPSIFRREFILDLLWELFSSSTNLAFSPYSLQATMTTLLAGLNGESRDQIVRVLYSHYLAREFYDPQALADKIVDSFAAMHNAVCVRNAAYLQVAVALYSDAR